MIEHTLKQLSYFNGYKTFPFPKISLISLAGNRLPSIQSRKRTSRTSTSRTRTSRKRSSRTKERIARTVSSSKRKKPDPEARTVLEELKEAEVLVVTSPENVTRVVRNSDPEVGTGMREQELLNS